MEFRIRDVYFPDAVGDKVDARGIDEGMVLRALAAGTCGDDPAPLIAERWADHQGRPDLRVLARDPVTGVYLELGIVLEAKGIARCYHAMAMRNRERKRFEKARR
jgi:hypothetical protein